MAREKVDNSSRLQTEGSRLSPREGAVDVSNVLKEKLSWPMMMMMMMIISPGGRGD